MQVTLPSAGALPTEASASPGAPASSGTPATSSASTDFAMLLAALLAPVQPGAAAVLLTATPAPADKSAEEQPEDAVAAADDADTAEPATDDSGVAAEDALLQPVLIAASAVPSPTPEALVTVPQAAADGDSAIEVSPGAPTSALPKPVAPELLKATPLPAPVAEATPAVDMVVPAAGTVVTVEPPEATEAAASPLPLPVEESDVPVNTAHAETPVAAKTSKATFSVEASSAREAIASLGAVEAEAATVPARDTGSLPRPEASTRVPTVTPAPQQPAAAANTPQVLSAVLATANVAVTGPEKSTGASPEPEAVSAIGDASPEVEPETPEVLPRISSEAPKVTKGSKDTKAPQVKGETLVLRQELENSASQDPEPAVVLEKNTAVLAKNALNEHVRGASARELLASARASESRTEKPVEASPGTAPNNAVPMDAVQRVSLRPIPALANAATRFPEPHITTTFPEVGNEIVKQAGLVETPGERVLTLKLVPPSLGEVGVELKSTPTELLVRLVSHDASVRDALEHHATGLRESLARDGRETRVEIGSHLMANLGQTHDNAQGNRQAAQQDLQDRQRMLPQALYGSGQPVRETIPQPGERRTAAHSGVLNLFA